MEKKDIEIIIENEREWRKHTLESLVEIRDSLQSQNSRIRNLEVWRGYVIGISTIIAGIIAWISKELFGAR